MTEQDNLKTELFENIDRLVKQLERLEHAGISFSQEEQELLTTIKPQLGRYQEIKPAETNDIQSRPDFSRHILNLQSSGAVVVELDTHKIIEVNKATCELLGRNRQELLGQTCHGVICLKGPTSCPFKNIGESRESFEVTLTHKSGESIPVRKNSSSFVMNEKTYVLENLIDLREEKKTQQELLESKKKLEVITRNLRDIVWTRDIDLNQTYVSPAVHKMLGYTPSEYMQLPLEKKITPDSLEKLKAPEVKGIINRIKHGEKVNAAINEEFEAICRDGTVKPIEVSTHPVYSDAGQFEFFLGITRDITKRKEAEREVIQLNEQLEAKVLERTESLDKAVSELTISEKRYRNLFATMTSGVVVHNPDGTIEDINSAALEMLGISREQAMGITSLDPRWKTIHEDGSLYPGETHPVMIAIETSREVRNKVMGVLNPFRDEIVWININAIPIFNVSGHISFVYVVFEDISKRKIAEAKLRSSEEKYKKLFNEAIDSIFVVDVETGIITDCNTNACKLMERPREEIIGMHERSLLAQPATKERFSATFQLHLATTGQITDEQVITKSGEIRDVLVKSNIMEIEGRSLIQGIFRDVTNRKKAERELRLSQEQKNRFFDLAVDMLCIAGFDGYFRQVSAACIETLGWSEEELLSRPWIEFVHPDDVEDTVHAGNAIQDGETVIRFENRYLCKDGTYKWISWNSEPIEELGLIYAVARDITETKKSQDLIKYSQQSLAEAQRIAHLGNWTWDIKNNTLEWSQEVYRIFGLEEDVFQVNYENFIMGVHPEDRDRVSATVDAALSGQDYEVAHRIVRPDGIIRHVVERGEVLLDNQDNPSKMVGIIQDITEQVAAETQITELLDMSDKIFATSPVGLLVYLESGYCVMANETAAQIVGATKEQVLQQNFRNIRSWQESGLTATAEKTLKYQKPHNKEINVVTSFGLNKWLHCKLNVFSIKEQLHLLLVIEDISERKKAEETMKTAIQLNKMLSQGSEIKDIISYGLEKAVRISNSKIGFFHFVNPSHKTITVTAWSKDTMEHCEVKDKATHHPIAGAGIWADCIQKRVPIIHNDYEAVEARKGLPEGHTPLLRDMAIPLFDGKDIIAVMGVGNKPYDYDALNVEQLSFLSEHMINAIQRLRAENALATANQRFSLATRSADMGIWDWDVKNNSLVWDESMYKLYGVSSENFGGAYEAWVQGVHPGDRESSGKEVEQALANQKEFNTEFRVVHPDGQIRHLKAVADVYRDGNGQAERMIGLNWDITDQKRIEAELINTKDVAEKANRTKSEFLANMSHEIRTPLNAVIGFSELLTSVSVDQQTRKYATSIKTAGNSLLKIINDILDLSKIEAGMMDISNHPMNLYHIFSEVQQIFKEQVMKKGLEFSIDIDSTLPKMVILDEIRLRQVLLNIVGNAIKFTDNGYIRLTAGKEVKVSPSSRVNLVISVEDTGIGIAKEDQQLIFDSFKQQSGHITRKYGGTGLGLTICRKLVEMMNGSITVSSSPEAGSTFTITLFDVEITLSENDPDTRVSLDIGSTLFEPAKILVVDDIESNRNMLRDILTRVGLETIEAESGKTSIEKVLSERPDLILMDIRMPEMDGYEATTHIRKLPQGKNIPIISLSAAAQKKTTAEIEKHGLNGYLTKPINMEELFAELSQFIKRKDAVIDGSSPVATGDNPVPLSDVLRTNHTLREKFEKEVLLSVQNMTAAIKPTVVADLCQQLAELGHDNDEPKLVQLSENLSAAMKQFDLERVKDTIQMIASSCDGEDR